MTDRSVMRYGYRSVDRPNGREVPSSNQGVPMPHLQTSAGRVAYSDTGSGPTLVLLHATLHDRHDYDPVLSALATSHRVMAVDWPGHGESDATAGGQQVTAPLLADVLEEVVLEKDLRDLRLIGNSVGGFAAARLAIRHPGRVAGLVLVDNGGFVSNPIVRTFMRVLGTPPITKRIMPRFVKSYMQPKTPSDHAIVERTVARARTPEGAALAASMWRSFATPEHDLRRQADKPLRSHPDRVGQEGQGRPPLSRTGHPQAPAALRVGDHGHRARRLLLRARGVPTRCRAVPCFPARRPVL